MSFLNNAEHFVIIGDELITELKSNDLFTNYFEHHKNVSFIEQYENLVHDTYKKETTLFIIKHFDYQDTEESDDDSQLEDIQNNNSQVNSIQDHKKGIFWDLMNKRCSILGYLALLQTIRSLKSTDEPIKMVATNRPLQNLCMQNTIITFSGITTKCEAQKLLTLTRFMAAKSREDVTNKTTHLVAGNLRGLKYRKALELGLTIMSTAWVEKSYEMSLEDIDFEATSAEMIQRYKLKPFYGLNIAFIGFNEVDYAELTALTKDNEGDVTKPDNPSCTHMVIDAVPGVDNNYTELIKDIVPNINCHVVFREWFWASLEIEGKAKEEIYLVPGFKTQTRRVSRSRQSLPGYNIMSPALDYSRSPDSMISRSFSITTPKKDKIDLKNISARHRACLELLQTERNYVKVLETIVNIFKLPLENPDNPSDPILPMTDVKIIFGNLTNIYEVHKRMLGKLENMIDQDWNESNCIGLIFVSHSVDLLKAYPPFVNFFEDTKKTIMACDSKYPRFHAFLRRCQSKMECNRESLTELLIRPVQRLPSITLILTELIKRTDDSNGDKNYLIEALESIRRVMNLINEDKRKTEGQIAMFDIVNNIEDCPPSLLSALRSFVCKIEARLLFMNSESEVVPSRSHKIVLFLFSDLIEICKVRSMKRSQSIKSAKTYVPIRRNAGPIQIARSSSKKEHRHLDELRLEDIMNIYRKCQSSEMQDAFVIQARPSQRYDQNYRYYPIIIEDDNSTKEIFLNHLDELVPEALPNETKAITNDEIDFGYVNILVNSMEKSRLSRVLSIRQALRSPSIKSHHLHHHS